MKIINCSDTYDYYILRKGFSRSEFDFNPISVLW